MSGNAQAATVAKIIVSFATNRDKVDDARIFGDGFFVGPNLAKLHTGTIEVQKDGPPESPWQPKPTTLVLDPPAVSAGLTPQIASGPFTPPAQTAVERFAELFSAPRPMDTSERLKGFFFVYGYANTFLDAISSTALLAEQHAIPHPLCFSLPSYGSVALYGLDHTNAGGSHEALAETVRQLLSKLPANSGLALHFICHSMGAQVLAGAFRILKVASPAQLGKRYFQQAIFAASDERNDALADDNSLKPIVALASEVDLYTNQGDLALFASEIVNLWTPLGKYGPDNFGALPQSVKWIDCTQVAGNGFLKLGHSYFLTSAAVSADIDQVLDGKAASAIAPRTPVAPYPNAFSVP